MPLFHASLYGDSLTPSTRLARANFIRALLDRKETRFGQGSLQEFVEGNNLNSSEKIVTWWEELLLATELPEQVKQQLQHQIDNGTGNTEQRLRDALHLFCTLPEFQLA